MPELIQTHPENADEVVWARWKIVIILGANAVIEHPLIITKPGKSSRRGFSMFRQSAGNVFEPGVIRKSADRAGRYRRPQQMFLRVDESLRAANAGFSGTFPSVNFSTSNGKTFGTLRTSPVADVPSFPGFSF